METEAPEERRTAVGVVGDADAEALAAGGFRTVRFGRAEEAVAAAARGDVARVLLDAADVRRALGVPAPAAVPDSWASSSAGADSGTSITLLTTVM